MGICVISLSAFLSELLLCYFSKNVLPPEERVNGGKGRTLRIVITCFAGVLATVTALLACKDSITVHAGISSAMLTVAFAISVSDIFYRRIPVAYLTAFCLLSVADVFTVEISMLYLQVIGAVSAFLIFFFIRFVATKVEKQEALGMADVILATAMALALGVWKMILAFLLASIIGVIVVLICRIVKKYGKKYEYAFTPMLTAGFAVAMIFGDYILNWYLALLGVSV